MAVLRTIDRSEREAREDGRQTPPFRRRFPFDRKIKDAAWARMAMLLAMGLAAAGCSVGPTYQHPPLPIPSAFPQGDGAAAPVATLPWRDFFDDPELQRLIEAALQGNRDIRAAAARVAEARAGIALANAQLFPQLDAVATGTRSRTPADLSPTGEASTAGNSQAVLSAAWELDFWGRLRSQREAALQLYLATAEGHRAVQVSLVEQVALAYLLDREFGERIALARQTLAGREESLRILRRRYEVGSGSKLDMTQAQLLRDQAQAALQGLDGDREVNRNAIFLLVGRPVELADDRLPPAASAEARPLPAGLPSDLLVNRPDIVAAEHQLRAANANIGAARAAFFPNIALTGAYGTASDALERLFKSGSSAWSFTPTLVTPLFNGGRNVANLNLAEARRNEAVAVYERTIQRAFRDVSDVLTRRRQLEGQIVTAQDTLAALTERARLADLRFANGRSSYLEVLDAQRDLFDAQQRLVQLRRSYLATAVSLYAALGGGFPEQRSVAVPRWSTRKDQAP
ncbi:MAG: efflux transporter outer membrane subunit [Pseudomonadota bacterium]